MQQYARQQTALLLGRLAGALDRAAEEVDEQSIHDARVAMRRLSRCLQVFAPFYPAGSGKKVRRRISALLAAAAVVRDHDIAIQLVGRAGVSPSSAMMTSLAAQRSKAGQDLRNEIRRWKSRDWLRRWRRRLEL